MSKYTLAIETSCDDTSISILEGIEVISLRTFSQIKDHAKFGGVIPEVASRLHSQYIFDVIKETIDESGVTLTDIDRIAVTGGPGLVNTLQVGITVAKTLASVLKVPLYDINHIEAHAYSPFINKEVSSIPKKAIVLIASGGHTELLIKKGWDFELLGTTKDDSIGEAYDKVAKNLGYQYPGGPTLDKIANNTNELEIEAPVSRMPGYDFTYSGLKSHMLNKSKVKGTNYEALIKGFQNSAIKQLTLKIIKAIDEFGIKDVIVGGGVSANQELRRQLKEIENIDVYFPKLIYTGDNAAMIGYLAAIKIDAKKIEKADSTLDASPRREW